MAKVNSLMLMEEFKKVNGLMVNSEVLQRYFDKDGENKNNYLLKRYSCI